VQAASCIFNIRHLKVKVANQLARQGASHPLTGPQPALGISVKVARGVIRGWKNRKHEKHWQSIRGQRQAKGCLKKPSAKGAWELLNLSGNQLLNNDRTANRTLLKGHLCKMGLVHSSQCDTGKQASENSLTMFFVTLRLRPQ
jgi:hypothetical protein